MRTPTPTLRRNNVRVLIGAQLLCLATLLQASEEAQTLVSVVTFGSVIKLVHVQSGHRLHSHEIPYGTGSGQQSVTAFHSSGDGNSYWLVKGPNGTPMRPGGTTVHCGDTIRLQHVRTAKNLHSHDHRAPLSRDQEVSAYRTGSGDGFVTGDEFDDWRVECGRAQKEWIRGQGIRLVHVESSKYLASDKSYEFSNPIPQQLQVSSNSRRGANTLWKTDEGFYLVPEKSKQQ